MEFAPTTASPLHHSVDNSFVVDTFTELSRYYPIMSKTAISKISIDDPNRHPVTELMISFATRKNSEMNSQKTTLHLIPPYVCESDIEMIRYSVLSALFYSYQNEHHLAQEACNTTEHYFSWISEYLIRMNPELLSLLWSHTLLVITSSDKFISPGVFISSFYESVRRLSAKLKRFQKPPTESTHNAIS
ncbi:hypothetical protein M441DRAFT_32379 [Trichoderma asperellum CBS 433.97]|uniref:Uncharacterized protein n=1 Tax=Trichoderma asperellum (strain ATCC 204424 / CBS 433.97 / NBRC 101777) TaxID=1042311 RepID=A0A2T3YQX2_TRIA4|nr:hypothetical protein M441DRAFT_32379 [Trichoderma asperellum CBS 433.97]PTB34919.1 hypothetical protein M441DRAFT_32379 [Trichoderma asperellum CBS 433.97]